MQTKLKKTITGILAILLISMLIMGDVIAIAENVAVSEPAISNQAEEQNLLEIEQTLITSQEYKINGQNKKLLQFALNLNVENLQTENLQEHTITVTTPIESIIPEEIYVEVKNAVNFEKALWEYKDGKLVINFENSEVEKAKEEKIDNLIITYVYSEDTDTSKILTTAKAEGKTYNKRKVVSAEKQYTLESEIKVGNIIQINNTLQEIYNTELKHENQIYVEKIEVNLAYKNTKLFDKIQLEDNSADVYGQNSKVNLEQTYKTTLINKKELLNAIGENGKVTIKNAEDQTIITEINKDTQDLEEYIIVNYAENISRIIVEIELSEEIKTLGTAKNGKFSLYNKKEIEKNNVADLLVKQTKTMNITGTCGENEIFKLQNQTEGKISPKSTYSELGINKTELTNTQENEIIATITMHTEDKKYDLNKNPEFKVTLPKEIETVEVGEINILNNKNFKLTNKEIKEEDNGQKTIVINLEGEQEEYTTDAGNVQIVMPLKIKTAKLIPTTKSNIVLKYTNEKAESYKTGKNGEEIENIEIIADKDIIVATEAQIGEEKVLSYKADIQTIKIQKTKEEQILKIRGTIINNTEEEKENLVVKGQNDNLGEITTTKGKVQYSETADGTYTETKTENQKYYKIEIDKLAKGEKVEFSYDMVLPNQEGDKNYEVAYQVYEAENFRKESKIKVEVKPENSNSEEDDKQVINSGDVKIKHQTSIMSNSSMIPIKIVEVNSSIIHDIYLVNNSNSEKNIELVLDLHESIDLSKTKVEVYSFTGKYYEEEGFEGQKIYEYSETRELQTVGNKLKTNICLPANGDIIVKANMYVYKYVEPEITTKITLNIDNNVVELKDTQKANVLAEIEAKSALYNGNNKVQTGEKLNLKVGAQLKSITNVNVIKGQNETVYILVDIPQNFEVAKMECYKNGILVKELNKEMCKEFITGAWDAGDKYFNGNIRQSMNLDAGNNAEIIVWFELAKEVEKDIAITQQSKIDVDGTRTETEKIEMTLVAESEPDNPDELDNPDIPEEKKYTISGLAWLDKNRNGMQDNNEDYLKGIEVTLLDETTNEKIATTITDSEGKYQFKDLEKGKYVIVFGYNATKYNLTTYKKYGVEESKNSDGILTTLAGVNVAKTEVIEITNKNIANIDIGLILKEKFDLEVTKQIKKVTVKNNAGQTVYEYEGTNFAKIEIPTKYFKGTNLVIEYEVKIKNKGEISGYVKTLTDIMPEKLKFASELNTNWYEGTDGKLYCIELGEDEIKPGEERTLNLVLTKEIEDTKIQYITNTVELEEIFNEYLEEENDILNNKAEATLIVAIKTGLAKTYFGLWLGCITIIGAGAYLIKKKVIISFILVLLVLAPISNGGYFNDPATAGQFCGLQGAPQPSGFKQGESMSMTFTYDEIANATPGSPYYDNISAAAAIIAGNPENTKYNADGTRAYTEEEAQKNLHYVQANPENAAGFINDVLGKISSNGSTGSSSTYNISPHTILGYVEGKCLRGDDKCDEYEPALGKGKVSGFAIAIPEGSDIEFTGYNHLDWVWGSTIGLEAKNYLVYYYRNNGKMSYVSGTYTVGGTISITINSPSGNGQQPSYSASYTPPSTGERRTYLNINVAELTIDKINPSGKPVKGAKFSYVIKKGDKVLTSGTTEKTNEEGKTVLRAMWIGDAIDENVSLVIKEAEAAPGYILLDKEIEISLGEKEVGFGQNGKRITTFKLEHGVEGVNLDSENNIISIVNAPGTSLKINKVNQDGFFLAGAEIEYAGPYYVYMQVTPGYGEQSSKYDLIKMVEGTEITAGEKDVLGWKQYKTDYSTKVVEVKGDGLDKITEIWNQKTIYILVHELKTVTGYNKFNKRLAVKFTKNSNNEWNYAGMGEAEWSYEDQLFKVYENKNFTTEGNIEIYYDGLVKIDKTEKMPTLIITNTDGFSFNIRKVDKDDKNLSEATIEYAGPYKIVNNTAELLQHTEITKGDTEEIGWQGYVTSTDVKYVAASKINIEDIKTSSGTYSDVCVLISEKAAPEGYKKIDEKFAVVFRFTGETWEYVGLKKATWHDDISRFKLSDFTAEEKDSVSNEFVESYCNGKVVYDKNKVEFKLKNEQDKLDFSFKIKKTDSETGKVLSGVKFNVAYEKTNSEYTTNENGEIIVPIYANGKEEVKVIIHENTPTDYKELGYAIQLTFKKQDEKWKLVDKKKITSDNLTGEDIVSSDLISFEEDNSKTVIGIVKIKNEPDEKTTLEKIPFAISKKYSGGKSYSSNNGAKFKIEANGGTLTEGKLSSILSVKSGEAILIYPNKNSSTVILTITETYTPSGYKGLSKPVKIRYEKKNGKWESTIEESAGGLASKGTGWIINITNKTGDDTNPDPDPVPDPNKDIIEGYVYLDGYSGNKVVQGYNGKRDAGEPGISGVIVKLSDGRSTVTDENGKYTFYNIERSKEYKVTFEYDGVNYQATTPGQGSQASEDARNAFNARFATIKFEESNDKTKLSYFRKGETNWNPSYNGRTWILKTLNLDQTVIDSFKTTASTSFELKDKTQYRYSYDIYKYIPPVEADGNGNGGSPGGWVDTGKDGLTDWLEEKPKSTDEERNYRESQPNYSNYYVYGKTTQGEQYFDHYYKASPSSSSSSKRGQQTYTLNFGLLKREVDLSLVNDLYTAEVSINGKTTIYEYEYVPLKNDAGDTIDIGTKRSDETYSYKLELSEKDFLYGTTNGIYTYDTDFVKNETQNTYVEESGKELTIKTKYRIALNNQSATSAQVNNIAYYYDPQYELIGVEGGIYTKQGTQTITLYEGTSKNTTKTYEKIDISVNSDTKTLASGEQKYVYVTLGMKSDQANGIKKDVYNTIAEITSYSTTEGKVDIDSAPANAINDDKTIYYEDDTDIAPGLNVIAKADAREISGNVWKDIKTLGDSDYKYGNGTRDSGEVGIFGVIAQLIEVKQNGTENTYYVWDQTQTDLNGNYTFSNFIPGNYIVRFIYGNDSVYEKETEEKYRNSRFLTTLKNKCEADIKTYNGQDYKSTTDVNYDRYKAGKWYNEYHNLATNTSVARDNEARRLATIETTAQIDTALGESLKATTNLEDTYMFADTSKINIAVASETGNEVANITTVKGNKDSYFNFENINFALEERPATKITLEKHITGLRITANDGTTIVDAKYKTNENKSVKFTAESIYKGLVAFYADRTTQNVWKLDADIEEVIQGSTLEIEYTYTVKNESQKDYVSNTLAATFENAFESEGIVKYKNAISGYADEIRKVIADKGYNSSLGKYLGSTYYTGDNSATDVSIVKTHVGKIEDYVNEDLKFTKVNSSDFVEETIATKPKINKVKSDGEHYVERDAPIKQIVLSKYDAGTLGPDPTRAVKQTVRLESNGKLTTTGVLNFPSYIAQIKTAYSNPVGRRDTKSIPGNLKYISDDRCNLGKLSLDNAEVEQDSYWAEEVVITKPTGENKQKTITLTIALTCGLAIVVGGVLAIKKYII